MKTYSLEDLQNQLSSPNLLDRVKAASRAGYSADRGCLSILQKFISEAANKQDDDVGVAVRSIGQLIGVISNRLAAPSGTISNAGIIPNVNAGKRTSGKLSGELKPFYEFLLSELSSSTEKYSSSIIFSLCLAGEKPTEQVLDIVLKTIKRSSNEKMRYRGYQYISLLRPDLLRDSEWAICVPATDALRREWDIWPVIQEYKIN